MPRLASLSSMRRRFELKERRMSHSTATRGILSWTRLRIEEKDEPQRYNSATGGAAGGLPAGATWSHSQRNEAYGYAVTHALRMHVCV